MSIIDGGGLSSGAREVTSRDPYVQPEYEPTAQDVSLGGRISDATDGGTTSTDSDRNSQSILNDWLDYYQARLAEWEVATGQRKTDLAYSISRFRERIINYADDEDVTFDLTDLDAFEKAVGYTASDSTGGTGGTTTTPIDTNAVAEFRSVLNQFGLTGFDDLITRAIREDWSDTKFIQELRQSSGYLANPLFAANIERSKAGGEFWTEGQVIAWGAEARRLANQFGLGDVSDNYLASALQNNLSLAEIEHRLGVSKQIEQFGPVVRAFAEQYMGRNLSDDDIWEVFDSEINTDEFDTAFRRAQYQGRPVMLGFDARSAEEARAYEMMGLSPDEVYSRFEAAQGLKSRFEYLSLLDADMKGKITAEGLAEILKGNEDLVVDAGVKMLPEAQLKLQQLLARAIGTFNQGSGVVRQGTAAVGLLNPGER